MLHVITRLAQSAIATAAPLVVVVFVSGPVLAQGLKASGGGGGGGPFVGPHDRSGGGSSLLGLEIAFALEKNTSPAVIYAISRPLGGSPTFAYLCVVNHRYTGDIHDVSGQFRERLHVLDGAGELELSSGAGKSSFKIAYSIVVKRNKKPGIVESLAICNTPVELDHGRVFIVDLSSESPVVKQFDYPLPDALGDSRDCDKKARKVLDDLRESIATGHANKRLLRLRLPSDEEKPGRPDRDPANQAQKAITTTSTGR